MKAIWKGTLSFGLITIPVELYSAVQEHALGFTILHAKCQTPIKNKRWCQTCQKEVDWDEIVKGISVTKDTYFIVTPENLKKLKPEKSSSINIIEFIKQNQIEPIYYNHHLYLMPANDASYQAYALLQSALAKQEMVAIGRFVLRDKEYVSAIQPYGKQLLLSTLHYAYEIKKNPIMHMPKRKKIATTREMQLAEQFIKRLSVKQFDISSFKDTFAEQLKAAIKKASKKKLKKGKIARVKLKKRVITKKQSTLFDALKASLEEEHGTARA